jgi:hypothetical protein
MGELSAVCVPLRDEGTAVWRPVPVEQVAPELFRLLGPVPDGEVWEFPPGAVVRCERRQLSGGVVLVAVERGEAETSATSDPGGIR